MTVETSSPTRPVEPGAPGTSVIRARLQSVSTPVLLIVLVVVIALPLARSSLSMQQTVMVALINVIMTVGLYVFVGNSGIWSFGHTAFALIGAYVGALATIPVTMKQQILEQAPKFLVSLSLSPTSAVLAAAVISGVVAAIVGVPLSRVGGLTAGLATVSLLIALNDVVTQWDSVTRGNKGLSGVPQSITIQGVLVCVGVVVVVAWLFQKSNRGILLRASKSDDVAAAAVGVWVPRERWVAFVISAMIVGAGGALFALQLGTINPDVFYLQYTFLIIAMLVVGGAGSVSGAVIGSLIVSALSEILRQAENGDLYGVISFPARPGLANVGLGIVLVVMLLRFPGGITGGRELRIPLSRPVGPTKSAVLNKIIDATTRKGRQQ